MYNMWYGVMCLCTYKYRVHHILNIEVALYMFVVYYVFIICKIGINLHLVSIVCNNNNNM